MTSIPPGWANRYDGAMRWYPYAATILGLLVLVGGLMNSNWIGAAIGALIAFFNLTKIFRITRLLGVRLAWVREDA